MKGLFLWICTLVIAGILFSLYLISSSEENALIRLKGKEYNKAAAYYDTQNTPETLVPRFRLKLELGEVDEAIALLQEIVRQHPNNIEALQQLAELYLTTQQEEKYFQALLELQKHIPEEGRLLQSLEAWYETHQQQEAACVLLPSLLRTEEATASNYSTLAFCYAQQKKITQASLLMKERRERFPKNIMISDILFEVWALSESEKKEEARALLSHYLLEKRNNLITYNALGFIKKRYPEQLEALMKDLEPFLHTHPSLESFELETLWETPRSTICGQPPKTSQEEIFARIAALYEKAPQNPLVQQLFFRVLLDQRQEEKLIKLIKNMPYETWEGHDILAAADTALTYDNPSFAREIQEILPHPSPAVSVALALGAQDKGAHAQLKALLKTETLTQQERYYLFKLAMRSHFITEAQELDRQLFPYYGLEEYELAEMAILSIDEDQGRPFYAQLEKAMPFIGKKQGEAATLLLIVV